jgi:uncharacterized repeat protein (TIGR03837 family)
MTFKSIDIFCHVIDNFGDIGVAYRFAKEFKKKNPYCSTRLFVDNMEILGQICPFINASKAVQEYESITYINSLNIDKEFVERQGVADVLVEMFACEIPEIVMDNAFTKSKLLINLDYLSAEDWVEGYHLKESLLPKGTLKKYFFMPGITINTGGLILNPELEDNRSELGSKRLDFLNSILKNFGKQVETTDNCLFGSVFTYLRNFDNFIRDLSKTDKDVYLFIFGGKSKDGILSSLKKSPVENPDSNCIKLKNINFLLMPFLEQSKYDLLLCHCDFNLVRGEDSLARAVLSAKPFIWNAYLQDNKYQEVKVKALLEKMEKHFENRDVFACYSNLMTAFNDAENENKNTRTNECYRDFFKDLNKIEHATSKMTYFIVDNCNLIDKFSDFLNSFEL